MLDFDDFKIQLGKGNVYLKEMLTSSHPNTIKSLYEQYKIEKSNPFNNGYTDDEIIKLVHNKDVFLARIKLQFSDEYNAYKKREKAKGVSEEAIDNYFRNIFFYKVNQQKGMGISEYDAIYNMELDDIPPEDLSHEKKLISNSFNNQLDENIYMIPKPVFLTDDNVKNLKIRKNASSYHLLIYIPILIPDERTLKDALIHDSFSPCGKKMIFKPFYTNPMFYSKEKDGLIKQNAALLSFVRIYYMGVVIEGIVNFQPDAYNFRPLSFLGNSLWFQEKYYYQIHFGVSAIPFVSPY